MRWSLPISRWTRYLSTPVTVGAMLVAGITIAADPAQAVTPIHCTSIGYGLDGNMTEGQCFNSVNDAYTVVMQGDGNLVAYRVSDHKVCWSSGTAGANGTSTKAFAQAAYNVSGHPIALMVYSFSPKVGGKVYYGSSGPTSLTVSENNRGVLYVGYTPLPSAC
jgi:hypothetical protein